MIIPVSGDSQAEGRDRSCADTDRHPGGVRSQHRDGTVPAGGGRLSGTHGPTQGSLYGQRQQYQYFQLTLNSKLHLLSDLGESSLQEFSLTQVAMVM